MPLERRTPGLLGAVRLDVLRLHETWMELLFPRQLDPSSVLGKWKPETASQKAAYYLWAAVGLPLVAVGYPLLLLGFATRHYADRLDSAATRLGIAGVVAVVAVGWGLLTLVARLRLDAGDGPIGIDVAPFLAVGLAGIVATASAAFSVLFARIDGRPISVAFAYPAGVTALFLPPVVAALLYPPLGGVILPASYDFAAWLLDAVLWVGGLNETLRAEFNLETFGAAYGLPGLGYVLMWFGLAVPTGWFLGALVALADVVRPREE